MITWSRYIFFNITTLMTTLMTTLIAFEKVEKSMEESFQSDVMINWLFVV